VLYYVPLTPSVITDDDVDGGGSGGDTSLSDILMGSIIFAKSLSDDNFWYLSKTRFANNKSDYILIANNFSFLLNLSIVFVFMPRMMMCPFNII